MGNRVRSAMLALLSGLFAVAAVFAETKSNDLIVIAAPTVMDVEDDPSFADLFDDIVEFDITYANAVYGHDNVIILVDRDTRPYFEGRVPNDVLKTTDALHIWMRDFTTVNPHNPVQFRYTPATFDNVQAEADGVQDEFNRLLNRAGVKVAVATYKGRRLKLDGGNIVDNYAGRVITTERFLEDNKLSYKEGVDSLKKLLGAKEVAIIPSDEPVMAHSDGMVMFVEENTLFVNRYEGKFRRQVHDELKQAFPGIKLVELTPNWDDSTADISSACGINLNATVTSNYIYMPHFDDRQSDEAMRKISQHTRKQVIPVPANGVCKLGGSVRCLSWQQSGKQGERVFQALKR